MSEYFSWSGFRVGARNEEKENKLYRCYRLLMAKKRIAPPSRGLKAKPPSMNVVFLLGMPADKFCLHQNLDSSRLMVPTGGGKTLKGFGIKTNTKSLTRPKPSPLLTNPQPLWYKPVIKITSFISPANRELLQKTQCSQL